MKFSLTIKSLLAVVSLTLLMTSCFNDLDTTPIDEDIQIADNVFDDPSNYKGALAKLYASYAVTGQEGPAGQEDISGIDEGFSSYLRVFWYHQELTTDEAVVGWNDATIKDFHNQSWSSQDGFIFAMYSRVFYTISICNEFLRATTEDKLAERGQGADIQAEVAVFRAEARLLRALAYYHALDLFRNVPFVTDADEVGSFFPEQISGDELFAWLETELLEIDDQLVTAGSNEYGRADQVAAWMLLAKLYLNAEVYVNQNRYNEAADYSKRVIDAGYYELEENYQHNFMADNDLSREIILPIAFDGNQTQTFGGTTFIINASIGGDMVPGDYGVQGGWGGIRTTSTFVAKFPEVGGSVVEPLFGNNEYPILNVPGAYQGWDPENDDNAIASLNDDGNYEGFLYFPDEDNLEFKVADGGWDTNWGDDGNDGTLEPGAGTNLRAPAPGFYRLNVNINDLTYTLTPSNWGLIGDATPGGWDSDTDMTYNAEEGAWEINIDLEGDKFVKFRENDAWDVNYGDGDGDGALEPGGDNIPIPGNGNYTIKLYLGSALNDYAYSVTSNVSDNRKLFFTEGQNLEINDISEFTDGYAVTKFNNLRRDGSAGKNGNHPDTDFPIFRLADAYLMYAEATERGATTGDPGLALDYVNQVRARAGAGPVSDADLDLPFLLDERARELYWECHRRTDLVRFGQFTDGTYLWDWKGGVREGTTVPAYRDIFPIPAADLGANPKLQQNPNY